mgnify:CR=1 FL=1|jgi:hypothetical protein
METIIIAISVMLCGLVIASITMNVKNSERISELEDKQEKSRKDINALYTKPLMNPKKSTAKKPTSKKTTPKKQPTKKQILKG